MPADRKADPDNPADRISVDRSRARFMADPAALWRNAYAEAGRLVSHDFWVPDMSGVDWDGVLDAYRPLLDRIAGPGDFADLLWEVLGELGTSHAYVAPAGGGASGDGPEREAVGLLGADLERADGGRWTVQRVLPGETSDPRARSPLAAPGALISAGDVLLAVDGQPLDGAGPGPLLVGAAGKPVELTTAPAAGGEPRRAVVITLASERRLRYQDWVAGRRQRVRELSQERVGYLHVPDMVGEGWADFHRDLHAEMVREALIVDVRGNRGGHTSQLVVEKLARRVIGWDVPRGMRPETYPLDAPRGPVVALADEFSGSDGDIVTAAIKILGLGPVVGTRTWGGVIGIDGFHQLVDGTAITIPRYATGWTGSAGTWRTTVSIPTSRWCRPPATRPQAGPATGDRCPDGAGDPRRPSRGRRPGHRGPRLQAPPSAPAPPLNPGALLRAASARGDGEHVQLAVDVGRQGDAGHGFAGLQFDVHRVQVGGGGLRGAAGLVPVRHRRGDGFAGQQPAIRGPVAESDRDLLRRSVGIGDRGRPLRRAVGRGSEESQLGGAWLRCQVDRLPRATTLSGWPAGTFGQV